MQKYNILVHQ